MTQLEAKKYFPIYFGSPCTLYVDGALQSPPKIIVISTGGGPEQDVEK